MTALLLLLGLALVLVTALLLASRLTSGSVVETLLAAYVIAFGEIVGITLALSPSRWLNAWSLLSALGGCLVVVVVSLRARVRLRPHLAPALAAARDAGRDPAVLALGITVFIAAVYAVLLAGFTPQNSDDALYYHLTRAALWKQHHGVGYMHGAFDARVNGNPPNAEIAMLFTMVLGGGGRYVGFVQFAAYLALALGAVGLARTFGLRPDQALFGGLALASLPIIVLQSSTALNDLVASSLIVAAVYFALARSRGSTWLTALAAGLAISTKVPAVFALPLIAIAALSHGAPHRARRTVTVSLGALVVGSYWYVVNLIERGSLDGGVAGESHLSPDTSLPATIARLDRLAIDTLDLAGASGRDRFVYAIAAVVIAGGLALLLPRRIRPAPVTILAVAAVSLIPLAFPRMRELLDRAHFKLWRDIGRHDLATLAGHDLVRAGTLSSWYGPLLLVLGVPAAVLVWRRRQEHRLPRTATLFALAPVYGIVVLAFALAYQDLSGRFLMPEVALAASVWGIVVRTRVLAWATVAIASATLLLTAVNDAERPAGIRLLARTHRSIWTEPRWQAQTAMTEPEIGPVLAFFDGHVPANATVAMATTPSDEIYPFFGPGLERRIVFPSRRGGVPMQADWLVIRPAVRVLLCRGDWKVVRITSGWRILRRVASTGCTVTEA